MAVNDDDEEVGTYPVSRARMQQFNANSQAAGAGGVSGGPLSQGAAPQAQASPGLAALQFQGPYQALYQQMQQKADTQRAAQQEYFASLQKQEGALSQTGMSDLDRASMMFQAAGALGQTTRSGGFGETLGNVATSLAGPLSKAAEAQRTRASQLQQLQLARQKLGMEMAGSGGVDPAQAMQLLQAQQAAQKAAQPVLSDTQKLLQDPTLTPEERKAALRKSLKLDEDAKTDKNADVKNIMLGDGSTISVRYKDGQPVDPITGEPFDLAKVRALTQSTAAADRTEASRASGIPVPERDMLANIKNPKIREQQQAKMMDEARKVLTTEEVKSPSGGIMEDMREAQRFLDINNEHQAQTGPWVGKVPAFTQPAEEMDKISAGLSRKLRQPGEGTMSNWDGQQFQKAFLSRNNDFGVNRNIGLGFVAVKQLELDRREFFNAYAEQNGNLQGAQAHWNKYLNANPVFDKEKSRGKSIELNPNRMDYQDYFRKEMEPRNFVRDENGKLVIQQGN
jgi:hypothetical protein